MHVKELHLAEHAGKPTGDLRPFIRPCPIVHELDPLEQVLSEMQRKGNHMALVYDADEHWSGLITMEDAIEEVIGAIEEKFPVEPAAQLSDFLVPENVLLNVPGQSILSATRHVLSLLPHVDLTEPIDDIVLHVADRERLASTYVGAAWLFLLPVCLVSQNL